MAVLDNHLVIPPIPVIELGQQVQQINGRFFRIHVPTLNEIVPFNELAVFVGRLSIIHNTDGRYS
jgi:hypothetical protein